MYDVWTLVKALWGQAPSDITTCHFMTEESKDFIDSYQVQLYRRFELDKWLQRFVSEDVDKKLTEIHSLPPSAEKSYQLILEVQIIIL